MHILVSRAYSAPVDDVGGSKCDNAPARVYDDDDDPTALDYLWTYYPPSASVVGEGGLVQSDRYLGGWIVVIVRIFTLCDLDGEDRLVIL